MPELPDLELFAKNLNKALAGKQLLRIKVIVDKKLNVSEGELNESLKNHTLEKVYREGKELFFLFSGNELLSLHLMLRGNLFLFSEKNEEKYSLMELYFTGNTGLVITDVLKMAAVHFRPEKKTSPDALSKTVNYAWLKQQMKDSDALIKSLLVNQEILRGIGNAYSDEILWDAGISPFSIAAKVPDENIKKLSASIKKVLKNGIRKVQELQGNSIAGEERSFLKIHNPEKEKSPGGAFIEHKKISGRKTYFTAEQQLFI